jgi:site-specific DNA-cytosine methylase
LDWKIPKDYKESFVRQLIGEAVPPLLTMKIVEQIGK